MGSKLLPEFGTATERSEHRLWVIVYDPEVQTRVRRFRFEECDNETLMGMIELDTSRPDIWGFRAANGLLVGEFRIGQGVRLPETDGAWGPAMVIDAFVSDHRLAVRRFRSDLASGRIWQTH